MDTVTHTIPPTLPSPELSEGVRVEVNVSGEWRVFNISSHRHTHTTHATDHSTPGVIIVWFFFGV